MDAEVSTHTFLTMIIEESRGGFRGGGGGGGHLARAPPKIWKNMIFFGVKSWFFTWNTPKISRAPPKIGKIFFFFVNSWFFTRNTPKMFAPPFSRRNFYKCAPPPPPLLTWNPGSAPGICLFHVVWTKFVLQLFLCGTHGIYLYFNFHQLNRVHER